MARRQCLFWLSVVQTAFLYQATGAGPNSKERFETKVRPLLAKNCYTCHTQARLGGLELNSREGLLKGGKSGPAVVPGDPGNSLLIQAISYTHASLKMPPTGRLSDAEVQELTSWVRDGAVWPDTPSAPAPASAQGYVVTPEQRTFWSFQPVRKPAPPDVKNTSWVRGPIDRFILAKLEQQGLAPAIEADRRTWIRRATFDLIGLPPTPEEVSAFLGDPASNAYEKVVDRLLASPRHGERWARRWLDIARYSDDVLDSTFKFSPAPHPYRDWVIQAFNDDMPYDLFVKAQFAADLLPGIGAKKLLPALEIFVNPPSDGFGEDDRVDVATRGFLGLTVACAKCHDHKYDPIPTKDYYALLGIFHSTKYEEFPLVPASTVDNFQMRRRAVDEQEKHLREFLDTASQQLAEVLTAKSSQYLMGAWKILGPGKRSLADVARSAKLDHEVLERWIQYLKTPSKQHPFLRHWEELLVSLAPEAEIQQESDAFQMLAVQVVWRKKESDEYNNAIFAAFKRGLDREVNDFEGKTMPRDRYMLWQELAAIGNPNADPSQIEALKDGVVMFSGDKVLRFMPAAFREYVAGMRTRLNELNAAMPAQYPFLSVIEDLPKPADLHVAIRGNQQNQGEEAPRGFLTVFKDIWPDPFTKGSGRLQLAEAIASPKNPLTARVMVNRIWEGHFGHGLVLTPSNFGQTGDRPVHPELLDYLAGRFIEQGWSLKKLHREIVLSETYRLSTDRLAANLAVDPDNRLHWRYPVRRHDAESLRDSLLFVTNSLDERMGGPAVPLDNLSNHRRTIYGKVSRNMLDPMLNLFDFPNPNQTSEQRLLTTVPVQRLFLLNSPLVMNQAEALATRLDLETLKEPQRIIRAYQLLFQRQPSDTELKAGLEYISAGDTGAWSRYAQVLLASNEFLYLE